MRQGLEDLADLRGQVWVADIIFSRCPGPCATMTKRMSELQSALPTNAPVKFISLTTDPAHDTPAVLKKHAQTLKANPAVWSFLTGDEANVGHFAAQFGLSVMRNDKDPSDISHTLRTVVIGPDGKIVKTFSGNAWTPAELLASLKAVPTPAH